METLPNHADLLCSRSEWSNAVHQIHPSVWVLLCHILWIIRTPKHGSGVFTNLEQWDRTIHDSQYSLNFVWQLQEWWWNWIIHLMSWRNSNWWVNHSRSTRIQPSSRTCLIHSWKLQSSMVPSLRQSQVSEGRSRRSPNLVLRVVSGPHSRIRSY